MPTIPVFNQKGGLGKTTAGLNLVAGLALTRCNPVAIDLIRRAICRPPISRSMCRHHVDAPLCVGTQVDMRIAESPLLGKHVSSFHYKVLKGMITEC